MFREGAHCPLQSPRIFSCFSFTLQAGKRRAFSPGGLEDDDAARRRIIRDVETPGSRPRRPWRRRPRACHVRKTSPSTREEATPVGGRGVRGHGSTRISNACACPWRCRLDIDAGHRESVNPSRAWRSFSPPPDDARSAPLSAGQRRLDFFLLLLPIARRRGGDACPRPRPASPVPLC